MSRRDDRAAEASRLGALIKPVGVKNKLTTHKGDF